MSNYPTVVSVCGKGRIAISSLSYIKHIVDLEKLNIQVVACHNQDDKGFDTWYPSLIRQANLIGVPLMELNTLQKIPDLLLISLEFDRILNTQKFHSNRLYNIHFSALPKYRGVYTSIFPILHGDESSGVTLHKIESGIDTGEIIAQRLFNINSYTTARSLYDSYMNEGFLLLKENFILLLNQSYRSHPQNEFISSSYNRKSINFNELDIDLSQPSEQVCRFIRAFHFPEFQLPKLNSRSVWSCNILNGKFSDQPPCTEIIRGVCSSVFVCGDKRIIEIVWA